MNTPERLKAAKAAAELAPYAVPGRRPTTADDYAKAAASRGSLSGSVKTAEEKIKAAGVRPQTSPEEKRKAKLPSSACSKAPPSKKAAEPSRPSTSGSMGSMEPPPEEEFPVDEGLESAVLAILCYEVDGIANLLLDAQALAPLLEALPSLAERLAKQHAAVKANGEFFKSMLLENNLVNPDAQPTASLSPHHANVVGVLRQLRREWSDDGAAERAASFGVVLDALKKYVPVRKGQTLDPLARVKGGDQQKEPPLVLVPGCGLGRLAFDIQEAGYTSTGVECSYLMIIPAWFILKSLVATGRTAKVYPHAHDSTNTREAAHLTRSVSLPGKVSPLEPPQLIASTFEEIGRSPSHEGQWDSVVTTFFADACSSVLEMVECVRNVLKPDGGVWINLGPLLYHGSSPAGSAKLCADELISLVEAMGFEILEKSERTTTYCDDPQAMSRNEYTSLFFVARRIKPEHPEFDDELLDLCLANPAHPNFSLGDREVPRIDASELDVAKRAELIKHCVISRRPAILTGCVSHWPALTKWDDKYLLETLGDTPVHVARTPNGWADAITKLPGSGEEVFAKPHEALMPFSQFAREIASPLYEKGGLTGGSSKRLRPVLYASHQNSSLQTEYAKLWTDVELSLPFADAAFGRPPAAMNFWMGEDAAHTSVHADLFDNVYVVVCGQKDFTLLPPQEGKKLQRRPVRAATYQPTSEDYFQLELQVDSPDLMVPWSPLDIEAVKDGEVEGLRPLRACLKEGELLLLPALWWHAVSQKAPDGGSATVAVNMWYEGPTALGLE